MVLGGGGGEVGPRAQHFGQVIVLEVLELHPQPLDVLLGGLGEPPKATGDRGVEQLAAGQASRVGQPQRVEQLPDAAGEVVAFIRAVALVVMRRVRNTGELLSNLTRLRPTWSQLTLTTYTPPPQTQTQKHKHWQPTI